MFYNKQYSNQQLNNIYWSSYKIYEVQAKNYSKKLWINNILMHIN